MDISFYADNGLINTEELEAIIKDSATHNLKILDASFYLPNSGEDAFENYRQKHIPGALFFDIQSVCDKSSPLPHMLPSPQQFSNTLNQMGISNDDFVVIYGQNGMVMGPARAWWMFRVFGHSRVAILNGGLSGWVKAGLPTKEGQAQPPSSSTDFQSIYNENLVLNMEDMRQAVQNGHACILDARPAARFHGETDEPRPGLQSGHIPGSLNLPCTDLIDQQSGRLKPKAELQNIVSKFDIHDGRNTYTTCGSGVTACFIAFALFHLGYKDVPVYDGSWSEWGLDSNKNPIERNI